MRIRRTPQQRREITWTYLGVAASIGLPWLIFGYLKPTGAWRIGSLVLTVGIAYRVYSYSWTLNWNSIDIRIRKRGGGEFDPDLPDQVPPVS